MKFERETYYKVLILADILLFIQLMENIAMYFLHEGNEIDYKNAMYSLYFSLFIFLTYGIITFIIWKNKSDSTICTILYFIYML